MSIARFEVAGLAPPILGRYRVLRWLDAGGMGSVFVAKDVALDRHVALKLLHEHGRTPSLARRLIREARTLAQLSHPNVVEVFDAGFEEGELFFAMELVEGQSLATWLVARRRTVREIIEVFIAAGEGLAAIHAQGVVHRDFKAANVVLTTQGTPKIVDFGLARHEHGTPFDTRLAEWRSRVASPMTGDSQVAGTPFHIAPEQLRGGKGDPRSDQFAFCVALYRALYGHFPFGDDPPVWSGAPPPIRPSPPGARVPARIRRALVRGLSHRPADRHGSMRELLAALDARPGRHWGLAGALALSAAASIAWAGDRARTWGRQQHCEGDTRAAAASWSATIRDTGLAALSESKLAFAGDAHQGALAMVDTYVASWLEARLALCPGTPTAERLGDERTALAIQCLDDRRVGAEQVLVEDATAARGAVPAMVAWSPSRLPDVESCLDPHVLEQRASWGEHARVDVLAARRYISRGWMQVTAGDPSAARSSGLTALRSAGARSRTSVRVDALCLVGYSDHVLGRPNEAERRLEEAFFTARREGDDERSAAAATKLALVVGTQGGRPEEGLHWVRRAESALARVERRDSPEHVPLALYQAMLLAELERFDESLASYQQAVALQRRFVGPLHPDVASSVAGIAGVHARRGDLRAAQRVYERALTITARALGRGHPEVAVAHNNLGLVLSGRGRHGEALVHHHLARLIWALANGPEHPAVATSWSNLGNAQLAAENPTAATQSHREALKIWTRAFGPNHPDVALALANLGGSLADAHELAEARLVLLRAAEAAHTSVGHTDPLVGDVSFNLGLVSERQGRRRHALAGYAEALRVWHAVLGPAHPRAAVALQAIGRVGIRLVVETAVTLAAPSQAIDAYVAQPSGTQLE